MLLYRRLFVPGYLASEALVAFRRHHHGVMLAIWAVRHPSEHIMEACQIGSRPGHQSGKPNYEIQWVEDDVGSAISVRYVQLVANIASRRIL